MFGQWQSNQFQQISVLYVHFCLEVVVQLVFLNFKSGSHWIIFSTNEYCCSIQKHWSQREWMSSTSHSGWSKWSSSQSALCSFSNSCRFCRNSLSYRFGTNCCTCVSKNYTITVCTLWCCECNCITVFAKWFCSLSKGWTHKETWISFHWKWKCPAHCCSRSCNDRSNHTRICWRLKLFVTYLTGYSSLKLHNNVLIMTLRNRCLTVQIAQ
jgi:hypothetical protein